MTYLSYLAWVLWVFLLGLVLFQPERHSQWSNACLCTCLRTCIREAFRKTSIRLQYSGGCIGRCGPTLRVTLTLTFAFGWSLARCGCVSVVTVLTVVTVPANACSEVPAWFVYLGDSWLGSRSSLRFGFGFSCFRVVLVCAVVVVVVRRFVIPFGLGVVVEARTTFLAFPVEKSLANVFLCVLRTLGREPPFCREA